MVECYHASMRPVRCSFPVVNQQSGHHYCLCFFTAEPESEDEDDSEDLLRRTGNFIGSSDSLPKGIIKVCCSTCDQFRHRKHAIIVPRV